jgi:molybdopterin-biosynthesis enzyme MoeA-like protein
MIAWVLDTLYSHLFHREARSERAVIVYEGVEAALTPLMLALEQEFPRIKVFSLPSVGDAQTRRHIELGVKGEPEQVAAAFARMCAELDRLKADYHPHRQPDRRPA